MTVPKRLQVELTLPIDPPHPFSARTGLVSGVEYMAEMEASR